MMALRVEFQKTNNESHLVTFTRDSGVSESAVLVTRSFLFHDLLHFALETEAGLRNGFYGMLAQGMRYEELRNGDAFRAAESTEIVHIERVVGPLTGVVRGEVSIATFMSGIANIYDAYGEEVPQWVTPECIDKVIERMRKLLRDWERVAYGASLTLEFVA